MEVDDSDVVPSSDVESISSTSDMEAVSSESDPDVEITGTSHLSQAEEHSSSIPTSSGHASTSGTRIITSAHFAMHSEQLSSARTITSARIDVDHIRSSAAVSSASPGVRFDAGITSVVGASTSASIPEGQTFSSQSDLVRLSGIDRLVTDTAVVVMTSEGVSTSGDVQARNDERATEESNPSSSGALPGPSSHNTSTVDFQSPKKCHPPSASTDRPLTDDSCRVDKDEEEGQCCPICFDQWTNSGQHRLVSLRCGHLFGQSCIEKWLSGQSGKCPQCNKRARRRDIRVLYAKSLKVNRVGNDASDVKKCNDQLIAWHISAAVMNKFIFALHFISVEIPWCLECNGFRRVAAVLPHQTISQHCCCLLKPADNLYYDMCLC